jgi:hypothetical protein
MNFRKPGNAHLMLCAAALLGAHAAQACTVGESTEIRLPLDGVELSNLDRLNIADAVIAARRWPDVGIRAEVIVGAYVGEKQPERLKHARTARMTTYLTQLGISSENILIEPKTLTNQMVMRPDGTLNLYQIVVELRPLCSGSCERLCNRPDINPTSRAIP